MNLFYVPLVRDVGLFVLFHVSTRGMVDVASDARLQRVVVEGGDDDLHAL